jgi:PRC-barrel domain
MKKTAYFSVVASTALAAAFLAVARNDRPALAQETTIQNQSDQQVDPASRSTRQRDENQVQNQPGRRITARPSQRSSDVFRGSQLIGLNVRGKAGDDEIGEINDVVIANDGKVAYVAVSFGGFLGLGDKLFAVPFEAIQFVREGDDEDDIYARIDVTEEQLKTGQGFNQENWPAEADENFQSNSRSPRQVERRAPGRSNSRRQQ